MPPILKLPTIDHQVPHDVAVAVELLRRAHDTVQMQIGALEKKQATPAPLTPDQLEQASQALSAGGGAPVSVVGGVGGVPASPNDPTRYLNGAALPVFVHVQDGHLALFDVLANNVSLLAHGFMPKLSGDPDAVLNGLGQWVSVASLLGLWAPVTNGDPVSPEILFDSNGQVIMGNDPLALLI